MRYPEITNVICDRVEDLIVDGRLDFPIYSFADAVAGYCGAVETVNDAHGLFYYVDDAIACQFVTLAAAHYSFYDLCLHICSVNIAADRPLPEALRLFACSALVDNGRRRPTPSHRERKKNWLEQAFLHSLTIEVVEDYGLTLTRNDSTSERCSACDAVAEALTICGRPTKYRDIKDLMVHPDKARLRKEFEATARMFNRASSIAFRWNALHPEHSNARQREARLIVMDILATFPPAEQKSASVPEHARKGD